MIELTLNQIIGLIVAVIGIFPSLLLFRLYFKTKMTDYFLFGSFFLAGILVLILDPLAGVMNVLILYQLHHITIDTAYLIIFIHACRMIWKKIPWAVLVLGIGYYLVLFTMTSMWQLQMQPANATVFFLTLPHSFSSYYPYGAGLKINGVLVYSTAYRYIGEFYRIFALIFLFYAYYFKTKPLLKEDDSRIQKARILWLIIWTIFLLHALSLFPWFNLFAFVSFFLIIAAILIFYIAFFLPEGLLLSSVQITRILPLYGFIIKQSEKNPRNKTVESIKTYLSVLSEFVEEEEE